MVLHSSWLSAVAGSGKTRFVADRVCAISCGNLPVDTAKKHNNQVVGGKVLCIGFSHTTVREMRRAVVDRLRCVYDVSFCTAHGLAASLLSIAVNNTIAPSKLALDLLWKEFCAKNSSSDGYEKLIESFYRSSESLQGQSAALQDCAKHITSDISLHTLAQRLKVRHGVVSYDDLLSMATLSLQRGGVLPNLPQHILVDEAQDLTEAQWALVEAVFQESLSVYQNATLTVVGDPNQIVYGFQGSSVETWQRRQRWWSGLPVRKKWMQSALTYRCGRAIVEVVNQVYSPKHNYYTSRSWVELLCNEGLTSEQCARQAVRGVCAILQTEDARPEDILVLVKRRGVLLQGLLHHFSAHNIAVSGLSRSIVDDLELLVPFFRLASAESYTDTLVFDVLEVLCSSTELLYRRARERSGSVEDMAKEFYPEVWEIVASVRAARYDLGLFLTTLAKHIVVREAVFDLAAMYCAETSGHPADFVEYCESQQTVCTAQVSGCVRVLTIHSAKGLQAKYVVVADSYENPYRAHGNQRGAADNLPAVWGMPSSTCGSDTSVREADSNRASLLQASRNLLYVALTRAERGVLLCGVGRVAADSFADLVGSALRNLGVKECVGKLGNCLRLECD